MWIKSILVVCCVAAVCLADEPKKKEDSRGKRNLQYSIAHYGGGHPSWERRISTAASQIPSLYSHPPQFFPGPSRSHSPYHNKDGHSDDLLTDNNHLTENVYHHKQIVERPVYIKEPEPIIEIIIKESNVTLPPPPTQPPPPPKKKEQVQVFYVKYKKNPNGHGKDSVVYDKPIPAISPPIHDEQEEPQEEHHHHHQEVVTVPPPPSTTLRTIIRPESETYHSPSGVKVTFGKEGFDYDKRSNKPEDLKAALPSEHQRSIQFPQGRQLQSFPPSFPRSSNRPPAIFSGFSSNPPNFRQEQQRQPQPYRPFSHQPSPYRPAPQSFPRPNPAPQQYSTLPKYLTEAPKPNFPPPSRPAPPQFHQQPQQPSRQPVPYQPFETLRPQPNQQIQFRPQTHFPVPQNGFGHSPNFQQQHPEPVRQQPFKQPPQQQLPKQNTSPQFKPQPFPPQQQPNLGPTQQFPPLQQHFNQQPFNSQQFNHQQQPQQQFNQPQENPLQHTQNVLPPGGELIHSLPKFEQHISILEPNNPQPQALPLQPNNHQQIQPDIHSHGQPIIQNQRPDFNEQIQHQAQPQRPIQTNFKEQIHHHSQTPRPTQTNLNEHRPQPQTQQDLNEKIQQQLREANALQESIRNTHTHQQFFNYNQDQQPRFLPTTTHYQTTTSRSYSSTTTTTTPAPTTTQEPEKPSTTTKDPKILEAQLPSEVPDDLREQLLSSGILNNADISILDYDKVGDIPLSALPPDQLANFYNAGGAQQISSAGSAPIPAVVKTDGSAVDRIETSASEIEPVRTKPEVQMKVVHYDPQTERGQQVQDAYVKDDARQVEPVVLNDEKYNRYLPLKVSGTQFPIPDVPELKGKKISSVVVLAPVHYDFSSERKTRQVKKEEDIDLIEGDALKELLKNPTKENFNKFLESQNKTRTDKQAVILLVATGTKSGDKKDKEIFMYDVATKTVNKLDGELSSAFVEAAEANATDDKEEEEPAASNIVETRVPYTGPSTLTDSNVDLDSSASDFVESKVPLIDATDLDTDASEHLESFVDISGMPVADDLTAAASESGFSKTGRRLLPLP